jgi:uncharacterized C2H2 Zn-finger protein
MTSHINKKNKCFKDGIMKCHLCGQIFDRRDNLTRHLNRKKKCRNVTCEEISKMISEQVDEQVQKIINNTSKNINATTPTKQIILTIHM